MFPPHFSLYLLLMEAFLLSTSQEDLINVNYALGHEIGVKMSLTNLLLL